MRVLSWIFQPVYLLFFAIIAALYLFRAEILPEHREVEQSRPLIERMEQTVSSIDKEYEQAATELGEISSEPQVSAGTVQGEPERQHPEAHVVAEPSTPLKGKAEAAGVVAEPVLQVIVAQDISPNQDIVTTAAPELSQIESIPLPSLGELWYQARKSAMVDDINQAIDNYIRLTSSFPQHADGFGELGNLYYAQGDMERAITAYQQALVIYQSLGASGEALQLQKIIERLAGNSDIG